jgi:hypothetical protein
LRGLSIGDLQRTGEHEQAGKISVSDLAHYCAAHDIMHLRQIAGMLLTQVQEHVGGMRIFIEE